MAMNKVEIVKAKNGWVVWPDGHAGYRNTPTPIDQQQPLLFTEWGKLSNYLRHQMVPEMKGAE